MHRHPAREGMIAHETVMDRAEVEATLEELARRIHASRREGASDAPPPSEEPVLVGIRRRGVELASRLAPLLARLRGAPVPSGSLDITLYRDDFGQVGPRPVIGTTELPGEITGRRVVIVDDVLFTGRTVRAALDELSDFGRPSRVELCVLVDRGGRELPIQPDYVGRRIEVPPGHEIAVRVPELDGDLRVELVPAEAAAGAADGGGTEAP